MTDQLPPLLPAKLEPYRDILTSLMGRLVRLVGAPAALNIARRVPRLRVDDDGRVLDFDRDEPQDTVNQLLDQYNTVFGEVGQLLGRQATREFSDSPHQTILHEAGILPAREAQPARLLIVDDHVLVRDGLAGLIEPQPDLTVIGQAGTVRDAIEAARRLRPDLILMDITLPDGSGSQAARIIRSELPEIKIVFLTVHEDDDVLFTAIASGAAGYLPKSLRTAELLTRLRAAVQGEIALPPAIARRILDEFGRLPATTETDEAGGLTDRETEIVRELAHGASNREIARKLVISENTVRNHVSNILAKLHLHSRRDVAGYARKHHLDTPSE